MATRSRLDYESPRKAVYVDVGVDVDVDIANILKETRL
jgi:hypothetical protein